MHAILEEAAAIGTAMSRTVMFDSETKGMAYYPGSAWTAMLFVGGYNFETPPPMVTPEGIVPFPATGSRKLHARTTFFYGYTGITPAMCMRLTGRRVAVPRRVQGCRRGHTSKVTRTTRSRCLPISRRRGSGR